MSLIYILDKMTFFLHGLLLLSRCDHRASLSLALFCRATLNFDHVSLLASVRLFPRQLQRLSKTQATEIRNNRNQKQKQQMVVAGKNKQGSRCMIPSMCQNAELITDIIWPHVLFCY